MNTYDKVLTNFPCLNGTCDGENRNFTGQYNETRNTTYNPTSNPKKRISEVILILHLPALSSLSIPSSQAEIHSNSIICPGKLPFAPLSSWTISLAELRWREGKNIQKKTRRTGKRTLFFHHCLAFRLWSCGAEFRRKHVFNRFANVLHLHYPNRFWSSLQTSLYIFFFLQL